MAMRSAAPSATPGRQADRRGLPLRRRCERSRVETPASPSGTRRQRRIAAKTSCLSRGAVRRGRRETPAFPQCMTLPAAAEGPLRRECDRPSAPPRTGGRSEEHTSELQSRGHLVYRLLLEKKKKHTLAESVDEQLRVGG